MKCVDDQGREWIWSCINSQFETECGHLVVYPVGHCGHDGGPLVWYGVNSMDFVGPFDDPAEAMNAVKEDSDD